MTVWFYIKVRIGKLLANLVSAFVPDKECRHRVRQKLDPLNPDRCVSYLAKHYTQVEIVETSGESSLRNCIWVCWLQGPEQAPKLVTNCLQSIEERKPEGWQVVMLTRDSYAEYVDLPRVMIDKWQRGIITNTHFSDLLRIYALARHGGCWIDATCLMTGGIPQEILQCPLFIFHTHGEFSFTVIQSCFMVAQPAQYVMQKWCTAMKAYWEHENKLINYFTLHLMFIALLQSDERFARDFEQVPYKSDEPMHILLYAMMRGEDYSDELMAQSREQFFIQKLTYKLPTAILANKSSLASRLSQEKYDIR